MSAGEPRIVTLTLNPAVDLACEAEAVRPVRKIRTTGETYDAGGGGVNVARVVHELGGETVAVATAGGVVGRFLEELLDAAGVPRRSVPIRGRTRISMVVHDRSSGLEYRFVPEGPVLEEAEWQAALRAIAEEPGAWLVLSGSLPRGVPEDFYARAAREARARGRQVVLDTSGAALRAALAEGGLALVKPSLGEFEALLGRPLQETAAIEAAAAELARSGAARLVAVTLGHRGAVLASAEGRTWRLPAPDVPVRGASGAGDSFVAAMTLALARGAPPEDAFVWGSAAGGATVASPGTAHARRAEVEAIYATLRRSLA
ncbi:1-phosphofructokinase family hexose kinase [Caldovatus aquaticus]|uniref:Phosphofructokinase n=1 Tax=Caldovatus aquaticus TaxID=2865671 RepID=A0ABS7F4D4_9PROT|nr:1-phosphofructokinase family hexose kinase [Caldovatus aquaticus]MBW8270491.1 1-phosphofructokinase family hexose kinase [Caldovatus aquaticus]